MRAQQSLGEVNAETPEGQLLQQIGQEQDAAKKLALMEEFDSKYASHQGAGWVWAQMQEAYLKANQPDKSLTYAEKIHQKDPNDVHAAHQGLKAAEAKNDPALVIKWSGVTSEAARKAAAAAKPSDEDEVENWKARVDYAKQVDTYTEYSLYATALRTQDPAQKIALVEALRARNPESEYLPKAVPLEFSAHRQAKNNEKALAVAEAAIEKGYPDEEMLVFVADHYMQSKKEPEKVISYSEKAVEIIESKPKPEGVAEADWTNRNNALSGLALFMAGSTQYGEKKVKEADQTLRKALPLVDANDQLKAAVLFYLGLANYDMRNRKDALSFNQACSKIKSPFQAKAIQNVRLIQAGK